MKSSERIAAAAVVLLLISSMGSAAGIDFKDPRRALGREDNVRVDAQMLQDTLSPGSAISVTYQVENLSEAPIAIADKVADASFDPDSQTITLSARKSRPERPCRTCRRSRRDKRGHSASAQRRRWS